MDYNSTEDYLKILDELADSDIPDTILPSLMGYVKSIYRSDIENKYSAPMLWIGMYIASASLVCILAMAADLLHGLRSRKLWFPCKYFRINAAFITVISVAMKLPVDLSGSMPGGVDQEAKLGSMAFMCTMMANLLPYIASMDNNELLSNFTALSILVITLVVNVCIQIYTGVVSYSEDVRILQSVAPKYDVKSMGVSEHRNKVIATVYVTLLLVLWIVHVCSCLAILKSKEIIESKYKQGYVQASNDIQPSSGGLLEFEKLQKHVRNHWIMAGSGSPQFIAACFRTTSASGVICVIVTVLHALTMWWTINAIQTKDWDSDYSWSMIVILIVQSIGVVIGTIAPLCRCFATLSFEVSTKIISDHFKVYEVESYWTRKLHEWKRASIKLPFSSHGLTVVIETSKKIILNFCIEFQEGVVVACNIIALVPFVFMICVLNCFHCLKWLLKAVFTSSSGENTDNVDTNKDYRAYVLHLEDEMELAEKTLEGLLKSVNRLIEKGEKRKPENLINLIENKPTENEPIENKPKRGFHGVETFDHSDHHVPTILSKEQYHQDSWSLPVVTLTTIAVSLGENEVESLLKSVREGLKYVTLVEESLNVADEYVSIRKQAETLWKEVDVDEKWLGHKLQEKKKTTEEKKTAGQIVECFHDEAKKIIEGSNDIDPIHKSICGNSMYHITKTILLAYHDIEKVSQKQLFDYLSSKIADIMAACLTNIPQVIIEKCHTSAIEKREASVKDAARLLGKTKQIMDILRERDIPGMNPSDLPFINKWRAYLKNP